jgi:FkbM family methyltransferase
VANIPRYTRKLGYIKGCYTLLATDFRTVAFTVKVPEIASKLTIRPRTSDRYVFEQIFLDDDYALHADLHPRFIVDAGANVGYASIYFANRYPNAEIVAIEPDATNFRILCENVKGYPKVRPWRAGLWNKHGTLLVDNSLSSWGCTVSEVQPYDKVDDNNACCIEAITVDDVLLRSGHERIDILKLDIEGAEREVFSDSCHSWLSLTTVLILELHDHIKPGCSAALERAIHDDNFSRTSRGENVVLARSKSYTD